MRRCAAAVQDGGWLRQRSGKFPLPAGIDDRGPYWYEDEVYRWAAASAERRLVWVAPLRYWPAAEQPAPYRGARQLRGFVVQLWAMPLGVIGVMWRTLPRYSDGSVHDILDELPDVDALVRVQSDFGIDGPGLSTVQRLGTQGWNDFGMGWQDLSRVLGQPAPYWPFMLRTARLITLHWPSGTVLTREVLEVAREGRPYDKP